MNACLIIGVVFFLATFSLGSSLQCYTCAGDSCSVVTDCAPSQDACLKLSAQGGITIGQCLRYSDCDLSQVSQVFTGMTGMKFECCTSNLCNGSPATMSSRSSLGLLALFVVIWCFLI